MAQSKRNYLTIDQLQEFADITVTDNDEAYDRIGQAEELIDAFVGYQSKHMPYVRQGKLTSVSDTTLYDISADTVLDVDNDYYTYCIVEIIAGTGAGQWKNISSSNKTNKSITIESAFTTTPDSTSIYKIHQLSKFPRRQDYFYEPDDLTYHKSIPDPITRATAAQVAYMIEMGDEFMDGRASEMKSERFGNYSYEKSGSAQAEHVALVSPRARGLLRGIKNNTGRLVADNPTNL